MAEIKHFTTEQVREALSEAQALVEGLELAPEIQGQAILWAAQKLSEKTIMQAPPALLGVGGLIQ